MPVDAPVISTQGFVFGTAFCIILASAMRFAFEWLFARVYACPQRARLPMPCGSAIK